MKAVAYKVTWLDIEGHGHRSIFVDAENDAFIEAYRAHPDRYTITPLAEVEDVKYTAASAAAIERARAVLVDPTRVIWNDLVGTIADLLKVIDGGWV